MNKSKRIVGPFQSEFGNFYPGDAAIAITVCTGRVRVDRVEYVGYVERNEYNYKTKQSEPMKFAQIRRPSTSYQAFWEGTDERASWPYGDRKVQYRNVTRHIVTTLQYNRLLPASTSIDQLMKEI